MKVGITIPSRQPIPAEVSALMRLGAESTKPLSEGKAMDLMGSRFRITIDIGTWLYVKPGEIAIRSFSQKEIKLIAEGLKSRFAIMAYNPVSEVGLMANVLNPTEAFRALDRAYGLDLREIVIYGGDLRLLSCTETLAVMEGFLAKNSGSFEVTGRDTRYPEERPTSVGLDIQSGRIFIPVP
jgi:hypothetical protein